MRKLLAIAAVILAFAFVLAAGTTNAGIVDLLDFQAAVDAALAADPTLDSPPNDGGHDFVVGGFQGTGDNNIGFSAHSGPLGEEPFGHLSQTIPQGRKDRFTVTCLAVAGNRAALGLTPTDAASNEFVGERVLAVMDSGLPGGTGDMYGYYGVSGSGVPANTCALYVNGAAFPVEHGNILVHDELP
jgi:hypothetical protein